MNKPEQIDAHDLVYLRVVREQLSLARDRLQRAEAIEQQAQKLRIEATALMGAHESYLEHLYTRHGLAPTDTIDEDGLIVRGGALPTPLPTQQAAE